MSEKEKELLEKMAAALPYLSEYSKGYINGVIDEALDQNKKREVD